MTPPHFSLAITHTNCYPLQNLQDHTSFECRGAISDQIKISVLHSDGYFTIMLLTITSVHFTSSEVLLT